MNIGKSFLRFIKLTYALLSLPAILVINFSFVSFAAVDSPLPEGDAYYISIFVVGFVWILIVNWVFDKDENGLKWRIRVQSWMQFGLSVIWGLAGILWYITPANDRLEPTTFLLTAIIAYVTYQLEQNRIKRDILLKTIDTS